MQMRNKHKWRDLNPRPLPNLCHVKVTNSPKSLNCERVCIKLFNMPNHKLPPYTTSTSIKKNNPS